MSNVTIPIEILQYTVCCAYSLLWCASELLLSCQGLSGLHHRTHMMWPDFSLHRRSSSSGCALSLFIASLLLSTAGSQGTGPSRAPEPRLLAARSALAIASFDGGPSLRSLNLSVNTSLWPVPASQKCLWRRSLLPLQSPLLQLTSAGFVFQLTLDDVYSVAVPCVAIAAAANASSPADCQTFAVVSCNLASPVDTGNWTAEGLLLGANDTGVLVQVRQSGGLAVALPAPSVVDVAHDGYLPVSDGGGGMIIQASLRRINFPLLMTGPLVLSITLNDAQCGVSIESPRPTDVPGDPDTIPLSCVCGGPSVFWREENATAVLRIAGFSNPSARLALPVSRSASPAMARPFEVAYLRVLDAIVTEVAPSRDGQIWRMNDVIVIAASGIGASAPRALFFEVQANSRSRSGSGSDNSSGGPSTCPPAYALPVPGVRPAPSNCTAVPCLEVSSPAQDWVLPGTSPNADGSIPPTYLAGDYVTCRLRVLTTRFVGASVGAIRLYYWRDPAADDDPPVDATLRRSDLVFDGSAAANGGSSPQFAQPRLQRHAVRVGSATGVRLDWLPRDGSGFLFAVLPAWPWAADEISSATGGLPSLAWASPAPAQTTRMWLVNGSHFIPCPDPVLNFNFDDDITQTAVSCMPHAGNEPAMRIVVELAGAINITRDGLDGEALLPIPIPGPPPVSSPFYGEWFSGSGEDTGRTISFLIRQPPWLQRAVGPDFYEPSPDAIAAAAAAGPGGTPTSDDARWNWRLTWDAQFVGDAQMLDDIARGHIARCSFGNADYPLVLQTCARMVAGQAVFEPCVTCVGVNETELAATLVPAMSLSAPPGDMVARIYLSFWWANVRITVMIASDPSSYSLRFWRRPLLESVVPLRLTPTSPAVVAGRNLCTEGTCSGGFSVVPQPLVLVGTFSADSVQPISNGALSFSAPDIPSGTPGWPVFNVSVRNMHGYSSLNTLTVRYPEADATVELAAPPPAYFVPCDASMPVPLPAPLAVRVAKQDVADLSGRTAACNLTSRTTGASLMAATGSTAGPGAGAGAGAGDVYAVSTPSSSASGYNETADSRVLVFPPFAVLAQFSVPSVQLLVSCSPPARMLALHLRSCW